MEPTSQDGLRAALAKAIEQHPDYNATNLARAIKRDGTYLRDFINGKKSTIGAREIAALEDLLGTRLWTSSERAPVAQVVLEGYRPPPQFMNNHDPIPVFASAEGGEGHIIISHDEIGRAPRPQVLEGVKDAYAILITGTSMVPAYKPGDRAWVNPTLPPLRETDCIFYAVDDEGEAKATIKELVTWTDAAWTVRQHNPAKSFKLDRGIWTKQHRVVGNFRGR